MWVRDEIEIYHEMERTRELKELLRDPGKHCKLDITIESGDDAASSSMRFNIKRIMVRPRLCPQDDRIGASLSHISYVLIPAGGGKETAGEESGA